MKILLKFLCFALIAVTALSAEKPASTPAPKAPVIKKVYELPKTGVNQQRSTSGWLNVEAAGRVKTHQRQRVGRREKRRLRLIGERDAQRERAMGGKFAHQSVGQF